MGALYAAITILAWGTWLAPSQRIRFSNSHVRTFYISAAHLALALAVVLHSGLEGITWATFALPFIGGLVWAVSGYCAFMATNRMGMAGAAGVWTPLNIIVGMLWGAFLFGEFGDIGVTGLLRLAGALVVVITGILMIILARGGHRPGQPAQISSIGLLAALGAGVLWGTYFIPIRVSRVSMWAASFPLATGMFVGAAILTWVSRGSLRFERQADYAGALLSGLLWGIGNYAMLLLTTVVGTGRGFTLAQLGVVVNATLGILLLKDPRPGSRAATITFIGVVLATLGGMVLGNL